MRSRLRDALFLCFFSGLLGCAGGAPLLPGIALEPEARAPKPEEGSATPSLPPAARPAPAVMKPASPPPAPALSPGRPPLEGKGGARKSKSAQKTEQDMALPPPHDLTLPVPKEEEEEMAPKIIELPADGSAGFRYDIPIVRNIAVERWIEFFTGTGRERFEIWLRRSGKYIDRFRRTFKRANLPQDLAYLPLIESGFSVRARSRAGAVGPWQFMRSTAVRAGLKVGLYLDERRDPDKSTRAAAAYLAELFEKFQDWHLALASYNAGDARVIRAMRRTGRKSYWSLVQTRYLPHETRNYVAKFIAGIIIAKNPEVFGFSPVEYDPPLRYETVQLPRGISFREAARLARVPVEKIVELNPELRRWITPPGAGHKLRLPPGTGRRFLARLATVKPDPYPALGRYRIQRGDTLGEISQRFGIPLQMLMELNANLNPRRLQIGTKIVLPFLSRGARAKGTGGRRLNGARPSHHVVNAGESAWSIARRYGIPLDTLLRWNNLSQKTILRPGDRLRIRR